MAYKHTTSPRSADAVVTFEAARRALHRSRRVYTVTASIVFATAFVLACRIGEVSVPQLLEGLPGLARYLKDITPTIRGPSALQDVQQWYWGLGRWLKLLGDTVVMAFLGTFLGSCGAFLLGFPASRNLMPSTLVYVLSRRLTEIARAVPELVYAMIFVFSFGLGPFPGVLAIAVHSLGALGKLFSELNENVAVAPLEGVSAAGGSWCQMLRYAVVPQVFPGYVSYTLLRFEINVRAAAVIGFVGAGGIGQELMLVIRQFIYTDISAIVLLIIAAVALIDMACEWLRRSGLGREDA